MVVGPLGSGAMGGRIVVFGATGYTGRLVAERLTGAGERPVLAGRSPEKLRTLADSLGGLPIAKQAGVPLLTAMGYDFVPGALAGALALEDAGEDAVRVDVGYYALGMTT